MVYFRSLVPRPPLAAFFPAAVEKKRSCKKSYDGRPGYEAITSVHGNQQRTYSHTSSFQTKCNMTQLVCYKGLVMGKLSSSGLLLVHQQAGGGGGGGGGGVGAHHLPACLAFFFFTAVVMISSSSSSLMPSRRASRRDTSALPNRQTCKIDHTHRPHP